MAALVRGSGRQAAADPGARLTEGVLVRPFAAEVDVGAYWLVWLKSKPVTGAMQAFREWIVGESQSPLP